MRSPLLRIVQLFDFNRIRGRFTHPFWEHVVRHRRHYILGLLSLIAVDAINVALPLVVRDAIDALPRRALREILRAGILYGVLMAIQAWGRYLWRVYLIGSSHLIAQDLRLKLYRHLQKLPLGYYQEIRTGDLMSRATNDIESIRQAVGPGILVTMDAIFIFVCIVPVMFWLSWRLTLIAFAFYPLVPWLTARLGDRIDEIFESMQTKMSQLSAFTQESFAGIRLIKSLVLESRVHERFRELSQDYMHEGMQSAKYQAAFSPALSLLTNLGTFLILLVGGREVLEGALTVGTFVAFQRFVVQLSWPMEAIGWAVTMSREGAAAQRRLSQIMRIEEVVSVRTDGLEPEELESPPLLEIRGLTYSHAREGQGGFRLRADSLRIESGKKIGIVGPVGSGKSTLFQLILRLYEPSVGTIFWKGRDIASLPLGSIRATVASVEQQVFLFSESIQENIFMGAGIHAKRDRLEELTRVACVWDEISELPSGLDTPLGERGVNLSGGQKQRVALARALAREPELLLLDDAFSAVDVEVENRIIANFFARFPDLALLFASHRLSVMPKMDEIWVMEHGEVSDRGTHDELMKRNPLYQALWQKSAVQAELERLELVDEEATEARS